MEGLNNMIAHKTDKINKQSSVECLVNIDGELERVLSVSAFADVTTVELYDKEARINGEVLVSVIYKTVDDQINTVTTNCTFQDTIKSDVIKPEQKAYACAKLLGITPTTVEGNTIKMLATVETVLDLVENNKFETYTTTNEAICLKTDERQINKFCGLNCADFNVESNTVVTENIKKVLSLDSSAIVTNTVVGEGYVSVNGMVCTYVVVLTEEDKFKPYQICTEFKEEIELAELSSQDVVEVFVKVRKENVKVSLEENEKQMRVFVNTPLKACVRGYKSEMMEIVEDIYSVKNELELERASYENINFYNSKYFESKIEGNLVLSDDEARIDKLLANSAPCLTVTNSYLLDGQVFVEGIINTNVVYLNDEDNKLHSVEMEIPFKVSEKVNLEKENINVDITAMLCDCDCMAKRGREIFFDCKLKVFAQFNEVTKFEVLSNVKEGRVLPVNDSCIQIYFAKAGNTVWEIAKELKISEQQLLMQNPDLISPLEKDEKVVVYYNL